ncbi:MAG: hypothetical protein IJU76_14595 [Desulfovibrionaceae bacterium]|nr:hypothetical protein [Desulfovibrionaceae bacterium]
MRLSGDSQLFFDGSKRSFLTLAQIEERSNPHAILATDEMFFFNCSGDAQEVHRPIRKKEDRCRRE